MDFTVYKFKLLFYIIQSFIRWLFLEYTMHSKVIIQISKFIKPFLV